MDSSYFPQDDYALTILTQAAMQTTPVSNLTKDHPTSDNVTRGSSTSQISNLNDHAVNSRGEQSKIPQNLLGLAGHHSSGRTMEALAFNPTPLQRQSAYMNPGYRGIGVQISQNYANSLGILSAESYDDGRGTLKNRDAAEMRSGDRKGTRIPFGVVERPKLGLDAETADSDEHEGRTKRRRKTAAKNDSGDEEDEARKKARGRPRVDTKDETAADRRRTQIRMAQRAYRHRKETTISSLEKQVQDLRGTNEEMNNVFINLYDFAVAKGLLQREPEFGQQLQSTTERFLALAKSTLTDDHEENLEESAKSADPEAETNRRTKGRRTSPKKRRETTPPVSEPAAPTWGGYELSKEDSPVEEIDLEYQQQNNNWRNTLQVVTRPTAENASFPFDLMDLQSYRVEVPEPDVFSQNFFPESQLPLPKTYSYNELSFARRIHRTATERAFELITSNNPATAARKQQVFGFCLLYQSEEAITARLRRGIVSSGKDSLNEWRQPFVHIGGAGTYYPLDGEDFNELMPKFKTGYSMGPFSDKASKAQEVLQDDMRCNLPGFEGQFFDPYDVEGYLRSRGLDIAPAAEYVTGEIDLSSLIEVPSPQSDSLPSVVSPRTPQSPEKNIPMTLDRNLDSDFDFLQEDSTKSVTQGLTLPLEFTSWDTDSPSKNGNDFTDSMFGSVSAPGRSTPELTLQDRQYSEKLTVTINVAKLLDELISRGVCLGRAPGFRPSDVNLAILAAMNAGL